MARILLVEDNEMNRDMLSRRLVRKGYDVIFAVNGEEAVAKAGSEAPDIILMDMSLPILDGWQAARRIKSSAATARIPIIALTAHAMAGSREACLDAGMNDQFTKPLTMATLIRTDRKSVV